ncbi:MAG: hypothetical protein J4O14_03000 [Chloroflexi bacterium]|nr:hypothetical protein [Chloroflexota bacterium]MCI0817218.1 hypothetical protein [Chloroflexota bacterium]MCI0884615.1 hypothetical protein [Chloroflexota bacterium]
MINRWMGAEIYFVHIAHGLLFCAVVVIVALNVPWWAMLLGLPVIIFSAWGWYAEAQVVLPAANQLLSGESAPTGKRMMSTATTAPRSSTTARRDEDTNEDDEEMRGNRWRI